jgi:ABC-type bacteriocin/lantibiotic exporter with double-glycine peptidase domain
MIKEVINQELVEFDLKSNGGFESLLQIIGHYRSNATTIDLLKIKINSNLISNTFLGIIKAAKDFGLIGVICEDINISEIIEYNQPLILMNSEPNGNYHFVVCYSYNKDNGFLMHHSKKERFYLSISEFVAIWTNKKVLAFFNN